MAGFVSMTGLSLESMLKGDGPQGGGERAELPEAGIVQAFHIAMRSMTILAR